ncbi:MAG: ATP-binding cassette domain-containing protein [Lachnospiraceae bacterium]|nr:ATP-binding cassette domain-containing protein [Lachnospiraceae bacterium]
MSIPSAGPSAPRPIGFRGGQSVSGQDYTATGRKQSVPAIELRGITKTFGKVVANSDVSFTVERGEILSILGENGSGKTTLMNMIAGIYYPDRGKILVNGEEVSIGSPRDAFAHGIGMIHQHFKLVDVFTATENIVLGLKDEGKFDIDEYAKRVEEISAQYGFGLDPYKKIYDMSVSEKQTVEIIKVLYRGADILILDEPTAVLTPQETEKLFDILRRMRDDGKSIIIITHKLHEVLSLSQRVAVLCKGRYVGTVETAATDASELTEMMVGKKISLNIQRSEVKDPVDRLLVQSLNVYNREGVQVLRDIWFKARGGEILGIAGIAGSGQRELLEAIAGLQQVQSGTIQYVNPKTGKTEELIGRDPMQIRNLGVRLSFVPEDRLGMGLVGNMDIVDNMMLRSYRKGAGALLHRSDPRALAETIINDLEVVTPNAKTPVRRLSGGNVQKVLVGREIASAPAVLMAAYPVRGLDINSSFTIYNLLNEQKERGTAVIFVGEDLDVLIELCDRIMVIGGGEITGFFDAREVTKEEIGLAMTAHSKPESKESTPDKEEETTPAAAAAPEVEKEAAKEGEVAKTSGETHRHPVKEPLFHVVKRDALPWYWAWTARILSFAFGVLLCGIVATVIGVSPGKLYSTMLDGAFGTENRIWAMLQETVLLLGIAVALTPAFKMRFWNIGGEGQVLMGGFACATCMILIGDKMPTALLILVMFVSSVAAGAIWALVPAFFKAHWNTNETLFTLMMNYIAMQIVSYFVYRWSVPKGSGHIGVINGDTMHGWLPKIGEYDYLLNILIVLVLTGIMFVYLKYSKHGYELTVVGESENTARYIGVNVKKVILRTMILSGAICGLIGFLIVGGTDHTVASNSARNRGFTAIMISWLAHFNPLYMIVTSLLIAFMARGAKEMASMLRMNEAFADILVGIIIFCIIGSEFFLNYRVVFRHAGKEKTK